MRSRQSMTLAALTGTIALSAMAASSVNAAEVSATNDPAHVWGAPILAVNPKNPNNIVLASIGNGFTKDCITKAATTPNSPCANMKTDDGATMPVGMMRNTPGFVQVATWTSFDHGKTWRKSGTVAEGGNIPVFPTDKYKGPAEADANGLTVTPNGTFYIAWDAVYFDPTTPLYATFGAIPISKSTDGGRTWSQPIRTGSSPDGGRLITDPANGRLYTFSSGRPGEGPMTLGDPKVRISKQNPHSGMSRHLLWSNDGTNWSKPQVTGGGGGSMTVAHGLLATAFKTTDAQDYFEGGRSVPNNELCGNAPRPCTIFQTSTDGGATWTRNVMSIPNSYGGQPMVAADPTKAGHFTIAFAVNANREFNVYRTADAGKTWSGPAKIAAPSGKLMSNPIITYGSKGQLGMAWRVRAAPPPAPPPPPSAAQVEGRPAGSVGRQGQGGGGAQIPRGPSDIFAAVSRDGGASFSQPVKINSVESPAPPTDRQFALSRDGGVAMLLNGEDAFFAWPDWRTGEAALLFNAVKLSDFKG